MKKVIILKNGTIIYCSKLPLRESGKSFTEPFTGTIVLTNGHTIKKRNISVRHEDVSLYS